MASRPNGTLYIGVTSDLVKRVWEHKEGVADGFFKTYGIKTLVYYELHDRLESAITREKQMKAWKRTWKAQLIAKENQQWLDLYEEIARAIV